MELQVRNPGVDYMIERALDFQSEDTSDFWSAPLYHFYPQLDRAYAAALPWQERKAYFSQVLRQIYAEEALVIEDKVKSYGAHWASCKEQITQALSDAFAIDCNAILNDMVCNVSLNPIEPRFLQSHTFDIFYKNSANGAIGETIHEIIHFVWFHVWNQLFADSYEEYESPSLKWILSEMVVEPIMRDVLLRSINPYFSREKGGCVYPYFYTMQIGATCILDTLWEMFRSMSISEFMKNSYRYCLVHETQIRQHIQQAEM